VPRKHRRISQLQKDRDFSHSLVRGDDVVKSDCFQSHVILIDMSGKPCSLHNSTSPFTTGPTFSGVPE
jgi:hypothetical protein